MSEIDILIQAIESGADVALVVISYAIWRIERRVLTLELLMKGMKNVK